MAKGWSKFPYTEKSYTQTPAGLKKSWDRLHKGDCEPFPKDAEVVDAWIAFHAGDFQAAHEQGLAAGAAGITVANKAQAIYANYLEDNDKAKLRHFEEVAARAEAQQAKDAKNANAFYWQAYALGRYAQGISIVKALSQGIGAKVKSALDTTVKLAPKHADAHIALGSYHAEIIDKVGALGRLTYGADAGASVKHFEQALKLNPGSAIAHMEYANGLLMLHGKSKQKQAVELYRKAAACKPADAMERLDVEQAKAELE